MHNMNAYLPMAPFDVYELHLFHLVATHGNFTVAGQQAGLTQSAITRQIQGVEERLGLKLFERTTRRVNLTKAGKFLLDSSTGLLRDLDRSLLQLREKFQLAPAVVRVGVARTVGLSYLPGFFVNYQRKFPAAQVQVVHAPSTEVLSAVEKGDLDIGLLCPPPRLPGALRVTHRFDDEFVLIAPMKSEVPADLEEVDTATLKTLLTNHRWLCIDQKTNTGRQLHHWLSKRKLQICPVMELDNFDLMVNLVSLGMGVAIVPHRTLPIYQRSRTVRRIRMAPRFVRELVVVTRKNRKPPEQITQFVENISY